MIRPGALPLSTQIVLDLIAPPIGAALWWVLSRSWSTLVHGGSVPPKTIRRQKIEFWILLGVAYALMIFITAYAYMT